jgi:hypothetical protein
MLIFSQDLFCFVPIEFRMEPRKVWSLHYYWGALLQHLNYNTTESLKANQKGKLKYRTENTE